MAWLSFQNQQGPISGAAELWKLWSKQEAGDSTSLRELCFKQLGRRLSSGGELISFVYRVEDFAREQTAAYAYRSGCAELSFDVQLTPQTHLLLTCTQSGRFRGTRLTWKLNGKRCSREAAYSAIRSSTEGSYSFELANA